MMWPVRRNLRSTKSCRSGPFQDFLVGDVGEIRTRKIYLKVLPGDLIFSLFLISVTHARETCI